MMKWLPSVFLAALVCCSSSQQRHSASEAAAGQSNGVAEAADIMDASAWVWGIYENESGLRLMHGLPESDVGDYTFMCERGRLHLSYSLDADQSVPYGTVQSTLVELSIGHSRRSVPAKAAFADGGSPAVDATISDAIGALRAMLSAETIETKDRWTSLSAPVPSAAIVHAFAKRCSIGMK